MAELISIGRREGCAGLAAQKKEKEGRPGGLNGELAMWR